MAKQLTVFAESVSDSNYVKKLKPERRTGCNGPRTSLRFVETAKRRNCQSSKLPNVETANRRNCQTSKLPNVETANRRNCQTSNLRND